MKSNKEGPGECAQRLAEERKLYDARVEWHRNSGAKFPPLSEGALIVDEVKVAAKMHWNSRDDSLVGHSLTADEMATLHDLYVSLEEDSEVSKADYILQTLWRDHSSKHDIVGPYYTSTGVFKSKFLLACVMDALRQFEAFNFRVSLLIVDGASANLTMIKNVLGIQGVFGYDSTQDDHHQVSTHTTSPFNGEMMFFYDLPYPSTKQLICRVQH